MSATAKVSIVQSDQRHTGIRSAIELLGNERPDFANQVVMLKPNFNSADPFPASSHNDTVEAIIRLLQEADAASITVAERSGGSAKSHEVADKKGVRAIFETLGAAYVVLEDLAPEDWVALPLNGSHWKKGIEFPRLYLNAESIVMTCCLKTHGFGGHFTMSLKNAVGLVPRVSPSDGHEYMKELHTSPHQRSMIAEINQAFEPSLVILDALSAFSTGGPSQGTLVHPGLILASTDRVAIDAVGVAILRTYETTPEVLSGRIFQQEQIQRAVELGLGVSSPADIELVAAPDAGSEHWAQRIRTLLEE
jgi:uncharacterized protein (DUF362 family)